MRILTLGGKMLTGYLREDGNQVMSLGPPGSIRHPLDRETDFFQSPESARADFHGLVESFRPDWILQVDDSTPIPHMGLESLRIPKAWFAVDSHIHWEWHRHYAPVFDIVFCAQKKHVPVLGAFQARVEWLPLSFTDTEAEFLPWAAREHDASFVGTLDIALNPGRVRLLDEMKSRGLPILVKQGDTRSVYRNSRVVINQSANDDLNFRFFEAIGYGALLVTDRISHSLPDMGEPGVDFLVYAPGDADDLHAKVGWALEHPAESEAMARRAQAKILKSHRISHRILRIRDAFSGADASPVPNPFVSDPGRVLGHLAAAHEHLSRLSLPEPLVEFMADEARRLALAALQSAPHEPWSSLVLAQLELEKGAFAEAFRWLENAGAEEGDEGYRRSYRILKALLLAHSGRLLEARQAAFAGLREFPGDANLEKLSAYLAQARGA